MEYRLYQRIIKCCNFRCPLNVDDRTTWTQDISCLRTKRKIEKNDKPFPKWCPLEIYIEKEVI